MSNSRLTSVLALSAVVALVVQLFLGAALPVLMLDLIGIAAGLAGFAMLGMYNLGSWVVLFYALGNVLVPLYAKTLFGQPLDSNLYAPTNSFLILSVTTTSLLGALVVTRKLAVGQPLFRQQSDPRFLRFLSWGCLVLGALFWALNRRFQDPSGSGFGGFAVLRGLLLMAVIARTAMLMERSSDRGSVDTWLGIIIVLSVFLGLLDNKKTEAALPVVSYFATTLFYRKGFRIRALVVLTVGGLMFGGVVAPMIHALRALGQQEMTLDQRVKFVTSSFARVIQTPQEFGRLEQVAAGQFAHGYLAYFGDNGVGQMLLGRYASVQQIDPVIAKVAAEGTRGGVAIWPGLARLVPSVIYPQKPQYSEAYATLVHYGLISADGGKFPTLPLAGESYAAYGVWGVVFIPYLVFVAFSLAIKKLGWSLYRNVYAIFFFCEFVIVYVSQGSLNQYAGAIVRGFPLFAITFWLLARSFRSWKRLARRWPYGSQPRERITVPQKASQ